MEHVKNFANLTKTFSANFPEFEELAPLYLLAFAIIEFDTANLLFFEYSSGFGFPNKILDELLVKLAAPKPEQRIFNPSVGIGSVFVEFQKQFLNYNLEFNGEVSNSFAYLLCQANLLANGVEALISNKKCFSLCLH